MLDFHPGDFHIRAITALKLRLPLAMIVKS